MKRKAEEEEKREADRIRAKTEREKELAKLRAKQQKAQDEQSGKDEYLAKRIQDEVSVRSCSYKNRRKTKKKEKKNTLPKWE